ncbi:DUF6519 domain-containing protein [Tateyamaria pelophila]|uniref:DUF6519 domain-containing protein n=1 Tax=Tateyamaria pelophila TaxID=328415 RepID=UPI001CBD4DCC|nr:DUF6519 domain-containing protein [Tateyamaria pelophila]
MSGDYSKDSFDALRDYAGVFLQQGRPVLDSDWNEMVAIFERRMRAGTVDTIGCAVVPRETPRGFDIRFGAGGIEVGEGHFYLDGVLYQNHGRANFFGNDAASPNPVFDRARPATEAGVPDPEGVLDEMIARPSGDYIAYNAQPYWPTPAPMPDAGTHLAYLVGWQRDVTPIQAPDLLDPALGGVDTTTRQQSVWQVRILPNVGTTATCSTPDDDLIGWTETTAPSTARLTTDTIDVEEPEDPCLVPPTEGYTGLENQFYRVEIHARHNNDGSGDAPGQGDWGFKFSRENASVQSSIEAIAADSESVTVGRIGRDEVLRFAPGDWVEVTDDLREFNHRSGQMLRVADVDPETREIEFEGPIEADLIPSGAADDTLASRHTRLIRWDQQGVIRLADETVWIDLDADGSDGLIPVPADGTAVVLENGITVSFATAPGPGTYREIDHWRFWARTAGTQIQILRDAPPDGVQRHYARLAILTPNGINDCRTFWPPLVTEGGEGCACTVCVTAELHNSGQLTINDAIAQVGDLGGTVCLEAGFYALSQPVQIRQRNAIRLVGQGLGTVLGYQGVGGAVQVESSNDIKLERFTVIAEPGNLPTNVPPPVHGVTGVNTTLFALRQIGVLVASGNASDRFDFGIAIDGVQVGTKIEECISIAPHALGSRSTYGLDQDGDLQFVALAEVRVLDCILFGGRLGVLFDRAAISIAATVLSRNLILSIGSGLRIRIAEIPAASLSIDASTIFAGETAALLSAGTLRVQDCELTGGEDVGDGLVLAAPLVPNLIGDAQIIGNTVFGVAGAGIRISGAHDTMFIKRNIIRDIGQAGVLTDAGTTIRHLAVDNNAIDRVGVTEGAQFGIGIGLTGVESGQVVGNSVRNVGDAGFSGQIYGGIVVQAVGSVDISSNVISDIGSGQPESRAMGIFARQPFLGININANRIFGALEEGEGTVDWRAIIIGDPTPNLPTSGDLGVASAGFTSGLPGRAATAEVYFAAEGRTWRASATDLAILLPSVASQITVTANQTRAARLLSGAMISLFDPGTRGITFSNNQVALEARGGVSEIVLLGAPRVAVSSNTVVHTTDLLSMRIVTGSEGAATPVGNITTGRILVEPGGMPAAFAPLNVRT